jgi:hypothetical protein
MINNMLLPLEYKKVFIDFLNINIEFHTKHKKFRFNSMWLDEIDEDFFHDRIDEFVEGLITILISSNNNLLLVDDILSTLKKNIILFNTNKINQFNSFSKFKGLINNVDYFIKYEVQEIYSIVEVLNYEHKYGDKEDNYFNCLFAHKDRTKLYKNSIDFERVKLFFYLNQFYKSLLYFEEKISFIKNAIQVYGVTDLSHYFTETKITKNKCNINLDKNSSAFLFKLLIEAKLIYMDENEARSESKIKKFAETYFNYTDSKLVTKPLTDFTKEYSKLKGSSKKDNQLKVLDILSNYIDKKIDFLNN